PRSLHPPVLPSFPTRRSSDLGTAAIDDNIHPAADFQCLTAHLIRMAASLLGLAPGLLSCRCPVTGRFFPGGHDLGADFFPLGLQDRKSTRLNSSHVKISYAVF